ncbi:MAG TPA: aminotransferase class V-fold PLP-dependent enzyme, partial [Acidimicrobiales bacterium]
MALSEEHTMSVGAGIDVDDVRKRFPILERTVNGRRLVYLDSASSSQKPTSVVDAMVAYYETTHANVHRGVYTIAEEATALYEAARAKVARFIGAPGPTGVIFAKNVTEGINLVAHTWARANLGPGDAILLTEMEHHANLVPWLMLREQTGVELRFLPVADDFTLDVS